MVGTVLVRLRLVPVEGLETGIVMAGSRFVGAGWEGWEDEDEDDDGAGEKHVWLILEIVVLEMKSVFERWWW